MVDWLKNIWWRIKNIRKFKTKYHDGKTSIFYKNKEGKTHSITYDHQTKIWE